MEHPQKTFSEEGPGSKKPLNVKDFMLIHPEKTLFPIDDTLKGKVIDVNPVQPLNAPYLMEVTVCGISTEVIPLQL
jgi:hypothetical protein